MPAFFTEAEIHALVQEQKVLPADFRDRLRLKPKRGHAEAEIAVSGENGSPFRLILRRAAINQMDFSVILGYEDPKTSRLFRLRRYNGKSHQHTNPIEQVTIYDFHIHYATERYQRTGNREDTFAEVTNRYSTLEDALECLMTDCGFRVAPASQASLFGD